MEAEGTSGAPDGERRRAWPWVAARLAAVFAALLLFALGLYGLQALLLRGAEIAIGFGLLIVLPYTLGALAGLLADLQGRRKAGFYWLFAVLALPAATLVVGGLLLREGVICIVMIAPVWVTASALGVFTVYWLHAAFRRRSVLNCAGLLALPFLAILAEPLLPATAETFEVRRAVVLSASPADVWPHLLALDDLSDREGVWTFAQSVLRIPRPRSAVVDGDVRHARWGETIAFEEHITERAEHETLAWRFAFPDDSIRLYTDRHIAPDGPHLHILSGRYELEVLPDGRTRLELSTVYTAATPMNGYCALWGEIILGGIQRNILEIVRDRTASSDASLTKL